ncbi:MAG: Rv2175c family DNA-binding protein [Scrofimicrobium sp.]
MSYSNKDLFAETELVDGPSAARMLGTKPSRIKQLIRDNLLVGYYADGSWWVPTAVLVSLDSEFGQMPGAKKVSERIAASVKPAEDAEPLPAATHVPLWTLLGTITVLKDGGFTDDEVLEWLFSPSELLDEKPIDALRSGRHHEVNSIASALAW